MVGYVDAHFRTVAGRAGRAIGGMSSGGYGALNLGLRDQDVYSVILSEMPYGDPGRAALALLGGSRARWAANSPDRYIPTMTFHHRVATDLLTGPDDSQRREAARLARMLRARGQPTAFTLVPGAGHTWRSAARELPYALTFASQHLHGLSDLLGAEVADEHGRAVGKVHDVRLEQAGPERANLGPGLRVEGLIVGRRALGARFGFGRGVRGPLLLKLVFGSLGDGHYVAWHRIGSIRDRQIQIAGTADDLPTPQPSGD